MDPYMYVWILGMNTFFGMLMPLTNNSILWVPSDLTWNGLWEEHHLAIIADFVLFGHLNKIRDYVFNV